MCKNVNMPHFLYHSVSTESQIIDWYYLMHIQLHITLLIDFIGLVQKFRKLKLGSNTLVTTCLLERNLQMRTHFARAQFTAKKCM